MKRVKAACLEQTLRFQLKDGADPELVKQQARFRRTPYGAQDILVKDCSASCRGKEDVADDAGSAPAKAPEPMEQVSSSVENSGKEQTAMKMNVQVGTYTLTAALEENDAVQELVEMMRAGPVTIDMSDYSGFEKVGSLGRNLTTSDSQITTAAGDIVLYNGNNLVMFYGGNSWSYTRIGKIDSVSAQELCAILGSGDVSVTFSLQCLPPTSSP